LINGLNNSAPPAGPPREITAAERISEDLGKTLIADAENCLTEAQNLLKDDQVFAEGVRAEVKRRAERHIDFLQRLHKLKADHENSRSEFQAGSGEAAAITKADKRDE
jgi:hypothetical protein